MIPFSLILTLATLLLQFPNIVLATANSICYQPDFANLRPCAQTCVGCVRNPDQIDNNLGCSEDAPNECYCRTNLFWLATSGLSSCVSAGCTLGGWEDDYTSALGVYTNYCKKSGYTAVANSPANNVAATTQVDINAPTITNLVIVTQTSTSFSPDGTITLVSTISSSSSSSSSALPLSVTPTTRTQVTVDVTSTVKVKSTGTSIGVGGRSGLSTSDKIAIGVGIGVGLPATLAGLVSCCILIARGR